MGYLAIFNSADTASSVISGVFLLLLILGSIHAVRKAYGLKINDSAISSGRVTIEWKDVEGVEQGGYGLHISAGCQEIKISRYVYHDPEGVAKLILEAVSSVKWSKKASQ